MSDFQTWLAARSESEGAATDESDETSAEPEPTRQAARDVSPFSMSYDLSSYDLDAETTDRLLTALVAATNLL